MATVLMAIVLMANIDELGLPYRHRLRKVSLSSLDNCGKVSLIDTGNHRVTLVNNDDSIAIDTPLLGEMPLCCDEPFYRERT